MNSCFHFIPARENRDFSLWWGARSFRLLDPVKYSGKSESTDISILQKIVVIISLITIIIITTAITLTQSKNKLTFTECQTSLLTSCSSHSIPFNDDMFIHIIKQRILRLGNVKSFVQ